MPVLSVLEQNLKNLISLLPKEVSLCMSSNPGSYELTFMQTPMWDKVFKNGPSKICGRQILKTLKTAFHKFYLVHS